MILLICFVFIYGVNTAIKGFEKLYYIYVDMCDRADEAKNNEMPESCKHMFS